MNVDLVAEDWRGWLGLAASACRGSMAGDPAPLTLVASAVAVIPVRPAPAASGPPAAGVRPFTVLASPVLVASGVTVAGGRVGERPGCRGGRRARLCG